MGSSTAAGAAPRRRRRVARRSTPPAGTAPVTASPPNGYGPYAVAGNLRELTAEPWRDRRGRISPGESAIRGGSCRCHGSRCHSYRVAARSRTTVDSSSGDTGCRPARWSDADWYLPTALNWPFCIRYHAPSVPPHRLRAPLAFFAMGHTNESAEDNAARRAARHGAGSDRVQ
ncbi:SUMF1/EgtB/PvdO family nonheme iron enzyme [Micromonospora sp. C28ISP2-4]|uniref:SUMF1/EgtB/PvdO family nonheme iron enzyme n=1 Tax=Micromonospora sp. C28ISP2-4 TaxID=3059523 RepID=UPI002676D09C|nr:SUMF1/EgtB/PvdO family nonheme iron enzyme [Micromonospora sp. C28ISP2-4]MDO3684108.1 SUMF1/EgtB/PvdO family nonheme iron enzyme [Micromonospora sp. C28ISP2-4]